VNRVEVSGGLTKDAEFRTAGNTLLATFTVAVNGTRWDSQAGSQVVKTTFVNVNAWASLAEGLADSGGLTQGSEVYVLGELDQYKREGKDQPSTRVTALDVRVIRSRAGRPQGRTQQTAGGDNPWA
jgi:single stranded DNA-binding protein